MPYDRDAKLKLCHEFAAKRGGECLSTVYADSQTKVRWRCAVGHEFERLIYPVIRGSWCPRCPSRAQVPDAVRRQRLEDMRALAVRRGGACESVAYISEHHKLAWRCAAGHRWEAPAGNVRRRAWCPYCSGHRLTIADMNALIGKVGGVCLSEAYIDMDTKLRWRCASDHEWMASLVQIRQSTACPTCCPPPAHHTYGLADLQEIARRRGGDCLADRPIKTGRVRVPWRCAAGHVWSAVPYAVAQGSWCPHCNRFKARRNIADMRARARYNGGECLSLEYVNSGSKLRWRCAAAHEWEATPANVGSGHWCPQCNRGMGRSAPTTLADIQAAVAGRGRCRAPAYINARTKLRFECARGHQWDARPTHVLRGVWCPYCAGVARETHASMRRKPKRSGAASHAAASRTSVARPRP